MNERVKWAAYASIGAGVIHGAAVGLHADHPTLSRIFLGFTVLQVLWGVAALAHSDVRLMIAGAAVNSAAVVGWVLTRTVGVGFVSGLEVAEKPQPADTLCALLAFASVVGVGWAWSKRHSPITQLSTVNAAYLTAALTLIAMVSVTGHAHVHDHTEVALVDGGLSVNADGVILSSEQSSTTTIADSTDTTIAAGSTSARVTSKQKKVNPTTTTTQVDQHSHTTTPAQALAAASGWPRPYDPAVPMDFSGIGGVTPEQQARAESLLANTVRDLPTYANYADAVAAGYQSIGDGASGFEHLINWGLIVDGRVLDTKAPESLVYEVSGSTKKLVSAMFIANPGTSINDSTLVNYAGGLMQWHVHTNLCWATVGGARKVVGVTDANGNCPAGSARQTSGAPMVHVWISAHKCGPFAALEGVGAGVADVPDSQRVDLCNAAH